MSQYVPGVIKSCIAGADLRTNQYHLLMSNGTGSGNDNKVKLATANAKTVGVLNNTPNTNEMAEVIISGTAKIEVGEAVENGKLITSNSTGEAEVVDAAGEYISGQSIAYGAADGDVIEIIVLHGIAHASDA